MNALLWVVQVFLASVFVYSGLMKSTQSERKLVAMGQTGVEDLPLPLIRFIGISELAGVLVLILPQLLNYWPVLSYGARNLADANARQLVCLTFVVFHGLTAPIEIYAYSQGVSFQIWANVGLRLLIIGLFIYYGHNANPQSGI